MSSEKPAPDSSAALRGLRSPLTLRFEGPAAIRHRLSLSDLVAFASQFQTALYRVAATLSGETESAQRGRRPAEIESSCSLDVVSIVGGNSVTAVMDLPPVPTPPLDRYVDLGTRYEDLGEKSLRTLVEGIGSFSEGSPRVPAGFDRGVLVALREAGTILDRGIDTISVSLGTPRGYFRPKFNRRTQASIVSRIREPTKGQRVVHGRLLMGDFKEADMQCRIHPPTARPITCSFDEDLKDAVLSALLHQVRVIGEATEEAGVIRSLKIKDLEILDLPETLREAVRPPVDEDVLQQQRDLIAAEQGVSPISDVSAFGGDYWPEGEDLEDFLKAIRKWRSEEDSESDEG